MKSFSFIFFTYHSIKLVAFEDQYKKLLIELTEKRDMVSNSMEKNAKLELEVIELGRQLKEAHYKLNSADQLNNDLNTLKNEYLLKNEELIKLKHEYENEKNRREKIDQKLNELKDEYKKLKAKVKKLNEENTSLQHQVIDAKNQFQMIKSKYESIADQVRFVLS